MLHFNRMKPEVSGQMQALASIKQLMIIRERNKSNSEDSYCTTVFKGKLLIEEEAKKNREKPN